MVKLGPLIQTPFCGSKQLPNLMLPGKLIFSVIQTHLMVKNELLQQLIYFVVKFGHLIQTFLVAQNQCFKNRTRLVRSVTFLVRFPLLGRLSIGPMLNCLGRAVLGKSNDSTPPAFFLLSGSLPHRPTLIVYPFFFYNKMGYILSTTQR